MRRTVAPAAICVVTVAALAIACVPADALARKRDKHDGLLAVLMPTAKAIASAHPHVNVIVRFGTADDDDHSPAAPATFKARFGRTDITADFTPIVENGVTVGMRTALPAELLRLGRGRRNRLRLSVDAEVVSRGTGKKTRRPRDKDRRRFRAEERPNQPPIAIVFTDSRILLPSHPVSFDASESHDPDGDVISHRWDFGDGTTSDDVVSSHDFADTSADTTVRLTVSDGQGENTATALLRTCAAPNGSVPGFLEVTADAALEFGPVATGATATRTVTVRNTDTPGTTVATCIGVVSRSGTFSIAPERFVLGGGESREVTLTFAPHADGHADAVLTVVGSARERPIVTFLAHGYGGSGNAPSGPTLAPEPFYYTDVLPDVFGTSILRALPDGSESIVDDRVDACLGGGPGAGDACVEDRDCAANKATCSHVGSCIGGANAGGTCEAQADCSDGFCPVGVPFDSVAMCGDGEGGLYLLSEDGTFTDPGAPFSNYRGVSVLALQIGADGSTTGQRMLARVVSGTTQMACDGYAGDSGGRVYLAEFQEKQYPSSCFRSEQEQLVTLRKNDGKRQRIMDRIDSATGIPECGDDGDIDPVLHLETSTDGARTFASFESRGLWRIRPTSLQFLDGDDNFLNGELFRLHPDGDLLYTTTSNGPTSSIINLYKIRADQVSDGPVPLDALTPCAVYQVSNNGYRSDDGTEELRGSSAVIAFDAAPASSTSRDATVLVNFASRASDLHPMHLATDLAIRGTVAFASPADSASCEVIGLTNLRTLERLTF